MCPVKWPSQLYGISQMNQVLVTSSRRRAGIIRKNRRRMLRKNINRSSVILAATLEADDKEWLGQASM